MWFKGQATSTRSLFYRQHTSLLDGLVRMAEEAAPTALGTTVTLGACKSKHIQGLITSPGVLMPTMPWCGGLGPMLGPLGIGVPPISSPIPQLPVDSLPNQIFNSQDLSSFENSGSVYTSCQHFLFFCFSVWGPGCV